MPCSFSRSARAREMRGHHDGRTSSKASGRASRFQPTGEQRKNVKILVALGIPERAICAIVRVASAICSHARVGARGAVKMGVGPAVKEKPFRRAIWLLFARTYRTSGLADETGTSRIKNLRCPDVGPRARTAPSSAASYKPDRS
jgi:hypothetical protein